MGFIEKNKNKTKLTFYEHSNEIPEDLGRLQKLTELTFKNASFIPESIGQLKNLSSLTIESDHLETLPASIGQLTNLYQLNINCKKLKKLPELLFPWSKLTYLSVKSQTLAEFPASFNNLIALEYANLVLETTEMVKGLEAFQDLDKLDLFIEANASIAFPESLLSLNKLQQLTIKLGLDTLHEDFGQLKSLERLSITMEHLTELPESIGQLQQLWDFNLYTPNLQRLPQNITKTNITALNIKSTVLTAFPLLVTDIPSLTLLSIGTSKIKEIPKELEKLTQLKSLYLDDNHLLNQLPASIGNLKELTTLSLNKSRQLKELPLTIGQLTKLSNLYLDYSGLTHLPDIFEQLQELETLSISETVFETLPLSLTKLTKPITVFYAKSALGIIDKAFFDMPLKKGYIHNTMIDFITFCKQKNAQKSQYPILCILSKYRTKALFLQIDS